jgi:hypothetical protein
MRYTFFALLSFCLFLQSCNDGDVIIVEIVFDQELSLCNEDDVANLEDLVNYIIYDTKNDPFESLTLLFPGSSANDIIFNPVNNPHEGSFNINESSIRFNYRTYDGDMSNFICDDIPPSEINIIEDHEATSGKVNYVSTFVDDDNDGIASELEDINDNGDLEDDDTDGDGIPNYKDSDDDGDNVKTKDENPDPNGDGILDDAQNTDSDSGDSVPDYLDTDDDGDGVITRYEDENLDTNPKNDISINALARYLDVDVADEFVQDELRANAYIRTVTVEFTITDTDLGILNTDLIELGTYINTIPIEN